MMSKIQPTSSKKIQVVKSMVGFHATKYATFYESVFVLKSLNVVAGQFYIGNRSAYKPFSKEPTISYDDMRETREFIRKYGMRCFIHSALLHNLNGSTHIDCFERCLKKATTPLKREKVEKEIKMSPIYERNTKEGLAFELDVATACGFEGVVVHIGSGEVKDLAIKRIASNLQEVLQLVTPITEKAAKTMGLSVENFLKKRVIILENAAGEGNKIGSTLKEIAEILKNLKPEYASQIFVCIDTCHLFAAGDYDISTPTEMERFLADFDKLISFDKLKVFHLNDSKKAFGCRVDLHEDLGKGYVWSKSFNSLAVLVNFCTNRRIPLVFETPTIKEEDIQLLYSFEK